MEHVTNNSESVRSGFTRTVKELILDDFILSIDLDADYQREKIWSSEDQQLLLDSIIQGIDIPKIYLAKTTDNEQFIYECVDGKQRMMTLLNFLKPEQDKDKKKPLTVVFDNHQYTYEELKKQYNNIAKRIEDYIIDFVVYDKSKIEDGEGGERLIRLIFKRLQLGKPLNSGERLKALSGGIRDFVFEEMGKTAPFLKNTKLSEKRYSRQFTLAQISLNSFIRKEIYDSEKNINGFGRARLDDLEDFFGDKSTIKSDDSNLVRIKNLLTLLDSAFGTNALAISSRAVAVSAYLFAESLYLEGEIDLISEFADFYIKLLQEIKTNMGYIRQFTSPKNAEVMDGFQKYILQASVEPYSVKQRNVFLKKAFDYFRNTNTKGKIIGSE